MPVQRYVRPKPSARMRISASMRATLAFTAQSRLTPCSESDGCHGSVRMNAPPRTRTESATMKSPQPGPPPLGPGAVGLMT